MKNNKIYTTLSIFLLISLLLIVFLVWPAFKEIKKASQDLVLAKNNTITLEAQADETRNFQKNYETYKPNLEKIDQLFIDPNNLVDFIKFLEDVASNFEITSQISLTPYSDSQLANQNFMAVKFSSKGSFSGVLNFIKKIEKGPYLIEIENLTIQNSQNDKVDATLTIKSFIKK